MRACHPLALVKQQPCTCICGVINNLVDDQQLKKVSSERSMANDEPGAAPADSAHASNGAAADANGSGFKLQFTSAISKKRGRGGDVSVQPKEEVR